MKHITRYFVVVGLLLLLGEKVTAQWDYLDVKPGYETLNIAIASDTTTAGQAKSLKRVYRLERGGTYLINKHISNIKGAPLRVWAAEGTGAKPLIIMAVDQTGANDDFAYALTDAHFKNLFISGIDMIGNQNRYTMAVYGDKTKLIMEGVEIDQSRQSHIRTYNPDQKIFLYDCIFSNSIDLATPSNGRFFDGRGLVADSIVWVNNTFYLNSQRMFRTDGAITKNLIFDHNTFYLNAYGSYTTSGTKQGGPIETRRAVNAIITNNIFQDLGVEGMRHTKALNPPPDLMAICYIDSTGSTSYPESTRKWVVKNNVYGLAEGFKTFFAGIDTVKAPAFISPYGKSAFFNGKNPNYVESNNFEEYIQFADAPKVDAMLNWVKYRFQSKFNNIGNPDPRADKNGIGDIQTKPETFGPGPDPYNFDYPKTQKAYTAGDKGLPVGDLNWFPDKKATWVAGGGTDVEAQNILTTSYELSQNYPNPFNPTTIISYSLPKLSKVSITVYNAIGEEIIRLVQSAEQSAGKYSVTWNGKDSYGNQISSGVYFYQLKADEMQITKKMLLVK